MCGIAGVLLPHRGHVPKGPLEAMTAALTHRGPDGDGFYRARGVAFGHRRLNVIDIEGGHQPMSNEDGTVWVTFNGEIFNHPELRADLVARGHRFASRCDTEVIVHGYEEWGDGVVERLSGQFAFAVWDEGAQRCLLARDRMGQKPLYYTQRDDGSLLFASEAKGIAAHPEVRREVSPEALAAYLTYEYLPADLCIIEGVRKLRPGHLMTYEAGRVRARPYWDLPFPRDGAGDEPGGGAAAPSDAEALARLESTLDEAVRRRLVADVPVGVFLSGGIDSSSVAAMAVHHAPAGSIKTFSIGFEDESFDESGYARLVARHLGTDHHERTFDASALLATLPRVVERLDEPFGDASLLPTFLLSDFTRESVTVALGGDGGDELLLGYPTFAAEAPARWYRHLPAPLRRFVELQAGSMPVDTRNFSRDFKVKSFLRAADRPCEVRHPLWQSSFVPHSADDPLARDLRAEYPLERVLRPSLEAWDAAPDKRRLQRLSYQYAKTYLAEDILTKVDRASMAVSLEARSPFLDPAVVEACVTMSPALKLRHGVQGKYALKRIMRDRLPREVLTRPKKGFGIPVAEWLKGPLRDMMCDLLAPQRLKAAGLLRPEVVSRLVEEHLRGRRDNRKPLWTLLMLELWRG
jgi:asparagine synthase (glutamine-hydrolysing)